MLANVLIVVVTYNRKELLKECMEALSAQSYQDCAILVVDNASTDGTLEEIEKYIDHQKVHYFNTGENLGGAGGFNYGLKKAVELGSQYVWLMDDDTITKEDALEKLVSFAKEKNNTFGFLAGKVLWKDGSICEMNIPRVTMTKNLKEFDQPTMVFMSSFVSLFLKTDTIKEVGYPIKEFFIWTDDWEYTRRISMKYPCYFVPSSVVVHKTKNKQGAKIASATKEQLSRFSYLYRNDVYLYRREGLKGYLYLFARVLLHSLRVLASKSSNKKEKIATIINATKEGFAFHPNIES
ncbi:MAG: glycosyltransferase family 2 protein [Solobacterium sp.]|nr:glycosyltransferase family 2 protein [Solobacterium sp.]